MQKWVNDNIFTRIWNFYIPFKINKLYTIFYMMVIISVQVVKW